MPGFPPAPAATPAAPPPINKMSTFVATLYSTVPDALNLRATSMHCLVLHLVQILSQVALQGRTCSSEPPMHSALHVLQAVAPDMFAKVAPSVQWTQEELPLTDENMPTAQVLHMELAFVEEKRPGAHGRHCSMPSLSAYFPGVHCVHCDIDEEFEK